MRVALAVRQVDIQPLKRPHSSGDHAQQRHASIIYPESRGPLIIPAFSCYESASRTSAGSIVICVSLPRGLYSLPEARPVGLRKNSLFTGFEHMAQNEFVFLAG